MNLDDEGYLRWAQKARRIPQDLVTPAPEPKSDPFMDELIERVSHNLHAARGWCAPSEVTYGSDAV